MTKMQKADLICLNRFGINFNAWLDKYLPDFKVVNERLEIIKGIKGDDLLFLQKKNLEIKEMTGVDFMAWIRNCAKSEVKCELEARRFLRENYPHSDVEDDKKALGLFMKYYYEKEAEHELLSKTSSDRIHFIPASPSINEKPFRHRHLNNFSEGKVQLLPHPKENIYDKPFRGKYLGNFVSDMDKLEFAMGFFPKE